MAKVVSSIGTIKGSIGGLTFQENPAGNIIRSRPRSRKSSTIKQQGAHQTHQFWLNAWQALTLSQKAAWNLYGATWTKTDKFGTAKRITGANWFESVNTESTSAGGDTFSDPPPHDLPADVPTFSIAITADALTVNIADTLSFDENYLLVFATPPTQRSSVSINKLRKKIGFFPLAGTLSYDITALWETATGLTWAPASLFPTANIVVCLQVIRRSSGISGPLSCSLGNVADSLYVPSFIYYAS